MVNRNTFAPAKKHSATIEAVVGFFALAFSIYTLRSMLIFGRTTLIHDNYYWNYPIFQFFAENIMMGNYPLWNPFSHGGEPFYPILGQFRLLEPIPILVVSLGKFITHDIVLLFNWSRYIQTFVVGFGMYLVLRQWSKFLTVRLSLIVILLYSSFFLGSFRQDAIINQFMWAPYIVYFLLRIIYYKDFRWHNWLILSGIIGLNWQSYFFSGSLIFLLFFFLGLLFFRKDLLKGVFYGKLNILKFSIGTIIVLAMMLPNVALLLEKDRFVFPARMVNASVLNGEPIYGPMQYEGQSEDIVEGIKMPYNVISHTGTFSTIWDFVQLISPSGNSHIKWDDHKFWGKPSEAYIFLGILPWAIAILGLVAGRHDLKKIWLIVLVGFVLLMLGAPAGLHRLLFYIYPPMWFVRHTHALVLFFVFALLYFYVLGLNHLLFTWQGWILPYKNTETGMHYVLVGVFSGIIILSFYLFSDLSIYLFIIFGLIFIIVLFFHKHIWLKGLFLSIIIGHIAIILVFSPNIYKNLIYIFLSLGVPFLLLTLRKQFFESFPGHTAIFFLAIFYTCLAGDLIYSFNKSSFLFQSRQHPGIIYGINTTPVKYLQPQARSISPHLPNYDQSVRYISLLTRKPFVFSPPFGNIPDTFQRALTGKRWNSFLLTKNYFELIHANIPSELIAEMFAAEKPIFQFKKGVILYDDKAPYGLLIHTDVEKSIQALKDYVFVDKRSAGSLADKCVAVKEHLDIDRAPSGIQGNFESEYAVKKYQYNSFEIEVKTEKAGMLYWSDGYDRWWQADINGKEVPIYRANFNFKAIFIPPGLNDIRFIYRPILFLTGLHVFYGSLIISVIGGMILWLINKYSRSFMFKE